MGVGSFLFGGMGQSPDPNKARLDDRDFIINNVKGSLAAVNDRQAPQAQGTQIGQVALGQASQLDPSANAARANQAQLAGYYNNVVTGQQAGAGELAAQRQAVRAAAAQQAMAASARGGMNPALAARTAARNVADIGVGAQGAAQQAALQDQAQAAGQLNNLLGTTRGQDIDVASQNAQLKQQMNLANLSAQNQKVFQQAGLDQATSLANMQARLQTMGMNDQAALGYLSQLFGVNQAEMAARLGQEQAKLNQQGFVPDLLSAGGQLGAAAIMSDRNLKTEIRDARADVDAMMATFQPYAYRYRDGEKHGDGERAGIMAQDVQGSRLGRALVMGKPEGLAIDLSKAVSASLAGLGRLHERLARIEAQHGASEAEA